MSAAEIFQSFENQTILIVGDVMLDRYLTGSVSRISPEAPVPVVLQQSTEDRLGGAANVALNVKALGGRPILCSVVGDDADGAILQKILPESGLPATGIFASPRRKTTVKTRILGNHQQMLRIDSEDTHDLDETEEGLFLQKIEQILVENECRALIFQDYNKGVLTERLIGHLIAGAKKRGLPTAVDPKKKNFFAYAGVDLFKPNLKEIRDSAPFGVVPELESLRHAAAYLREKLQNRLTMITLSEKGIFLEGEPQRGKIYPTKARNVADVSGAGDTVISIATMTLAAGHDLRTMSVLSNLAGGQVCEFSGVTPVNLDLLKTEFEHWQLQNETVLGG